MPDHKLDEPMNRFLEELSELTRRHGFVIGGCGCCGSPSIHRLQSAHVQNYEYRADKPSVYDDRVADDLSWVCTDPTDHGEVPYT